MQRTHARFWADPTAPVGAVASEILTDAIEERLSSDTIDERSESDVIDRSAGAEAIEARRSPGADERLRPLLSFFIPDLTTGGAERVTVNIVNGLADRGYDVELLLSRERGELRSQLSERVSVVVLPPSRTPVLGVATHLPALFAYLRRREPAALFPHLAHVSVVSLAVKRFLDVDTVVVPTHHKTFGKLTDQTPKDRLTRLLVPRLYPTADRIIAVSGGVADSIAEGTSVDRDDVSVLYNPIDVESVRTRARERVDHEWIEDDETDVVLFVGRIAPQKDLETWLRAFARVHDRNPDARAVLAGTELKGSGTSREDLLALADRLGVGDAVSMPGYVDNPYRYMAQADVFLLSSRYEGLPTVLVEALACGCPVVATDCPNGPREILDGGEYGRLVPVGAADEIAEAVEAALREPTPSEALRARADEFAPAAVLDDYERFIEEHVVDR